MTDTIRKRAERQRKTAAGYKRVECWFSPDESAWLKSVSARGNMPVSEAVRWAVCMMMESGK